MNYENYRPDWNKPSIFTAQQYGTKVSVEVERSDMDLDEVMDALQTLIIGLGYHQDSFKNWVIDRADEYREEDEEETEKDMGRVWTSPELEKEVKEYFSNLPKVNTEEEDAFFGPYDTDEVGYRATEEDEAEFDDYGQRIVEDRPHFEWGDEPEEDYDGQFDDWKNETPEDDEDIEPLFDSDTFGANEFLKDANERYKKEVKKMKAKQKRQSKK